MSRGGSLRVQASGLSDVGMARTQNEDCFDVDAEHQLYVVADGMGGHNFGEVASSIAVRAIRDFISRTGDRDTTLPLAYDSRLGSHANRLKAAVRIANDRVLRAIRQDGSLTGMGTTVVGLLLVDDKATVAHVGDSRVYRFRAGKLELLTHDHTWVNEQVAAGYLSEAQAKAHPLRNVVTRALGGETEMVVDVRELEARAGDVFLLCSDGLTNMLNDPEITRLLADKLPLEDICRALVREANAKGGLDNITAVLVALEEDRP